MENTKADADAKATKSVIPVMHRRMESFKYRCASPVNIRFDERFPNLKGGLGVPLGTEISDGRRPCLERAKKGVNGRGRCGHRGPLNWKL